MLRKSTTVFNYCGITTRICDLITDTTIDKQNTYSVDCHTPYGVKSPNDVDMSKYDYPISPGGAEFFLIIS